MDTNILYYHLASRSLKIDDSDQMHNSFLDFTKSVNLCHPFLSEELSNKLSHQINSGEYLFLKYRTLVTECTKNSLIVVPVWSEYSLCFSIE